MPRCDWYIDPKNRCPEEWPPCPSAAPFPSWTFDEMLLQWGNPSDPWALDRWADDGGAASP